MKENYYDFIIVLSHEMDIKGHLDIESSLRAKKTADIYFLNQYSKVITCGWDYIKASDIKICDAMANNLTLKYNIPSNKILREPNSRDTVGDAIFTRKDIIIGKDCKKIAVVTSSYHIKRTKEIFNFVYAELFILDFYACEFKTKKNVIAKEEESLKKFKQTFVDQKKGDIKNIYKKLLTKHSLYNGDFHKFNE